MSRVLFKWSDGSEYRSYDRIYDDYGTRVDGRPDTRGSGFKLARKCPLIGSREDEYSRRAKRGTLKRILQVTDENRERAYRRAMMREARENAKRERARRRKEAETFLVPSPLESLRNDIREGRVARSWETVTETYRVDTGDRHYLTFSLEAKGYDVQLERLYRDYVSSRRVIQATMREANTGDPRNVRGTKAWKRSRLTTTAYLTADDLKRASEEADSRGVEVLSENARGVTCIRYYRSSSSSS